MFQLYLYYQEAIQNLIQGQWVLVQTIIFHQVCLRAIHFITSSNEIENFTLYMQVVSNTYVVLTSRIHSRYQSVKNTIHLIPRIVYCNTEGRTSMILRTQTLTSIGNGSKGVGIAECQNPAVVLEGSLLSFLPFLVVLCFSFLILFSHQFHTHTHLPENSYIFFQRG